MRLVLGAGIIARHSGRRKLRRPNSYERDRSFADDLVHAEHAEISHQVSAPNFQDNAAASSTPGNIWCRAI